MAGHAIAARFQVRPGRSAEAKALPRGFVARTLAELEPLLREPPRITLLDQLA